MEFQNFSIMAADGLGEFDWDLIEKVATVSFDEDHRREIARAISRYWLESIFENKTPSSRHVRQALQRIQRHSNGLRDALSSIDEASEVAFNSTWPWDVECHPDYVKAVLQRLSIASRALLEQGADSGRSAGGRRRHDAFRLFVVDVHRVWQSAGGKGKGAFWDHRSEKHIGPMIPLVEALLDQIPGSQAPKARSIVEFLK